MSCYSSHLQSLIVCFYRAEFFVFLANATIQCSLVVNIFKYKNNIFERTTTVIHNDVPFQKRQNNIRFLWLHMIFSVKTNSCF
jgi:hypothetical protein